MKNKIPYIIVILFWLIVLSLLPSCTLTQYTPDLYIYEDHPHSTEVYYRGSYDEPNCAGWPYWGFYEGLYYYYGIPHFYPWWYYYQFIPPHYYNINTHIHIHCDFGYYVYGHRGPTLNNNVAKDFTPTIKVRNNKDKSFVFPRDWKSSNSTRINKQSNTNKIDYNRIFNINPETNIKPNNNRPKYNNNTNKGNNGSTRTNKTNTSRKPKR